MFSIVKQHVNLVELISEDTGLIFKQSGVNYVIDQDEETDGCPDCGHHGCLRIKQDEGELESSFSHCFSCGAHYDAISWTAKRHGLSQKDAALKLAKQFNIQLPNDYSPIQEIFNLAARYYETCLWETCDKPYAELGGLTPLEYQKQVRQHDEDTLRQAQVGWSDGGLMDYLQGLGFDEEILEQSGLKARKSLRDFLPAKCFIYPHKVKGRVSHWTFKDPSKRLTYQLAKKNSLNGYVFYGQDTVSVSDTVVLVEGENDWLSVYGTGKSPSLLATIGQLSGEQLDWLRANCGNKNIVSIFDPDDAGNKYRVRLEKLRRFFKNMAHIVPPDGLDVDEYLCGGGSLEDLVRNHRVEVKIEEEKPEVPTLPIDWGDSKGKAKTAGEVGGPRENVEAVASGGEGAAGVTDSGATVGVAEVAADSEEFRKALKEAGLPVPAEGAGSSSASASDDAAGDEELQSGSVVQNKGRYWRMVFKEGVPEYVQLSDFIIKLKNIYIREDGDRLREIVVIRDSGYRSDPFLVDSTTKVDEKKFRVLMANVADGTFVGSGKDLAEIWKIVSQQVPDVLVKMPRTVGRVEKYKGFLFRNAFISDSGVVTRPDDEGIFWLHGRSIGLRPEGLDERNVVDGSRRDIPEINLDVTPEEADQVMQGVVSSMSANLAEPGRALMVLGWAKMCLYADFIFRLNKGVPQLFLWGGHGAGKTTVVKWVQDFYGVRDYGSTSIPNLKTAVGWARKSEYYSCLPLMIDEVRSDETTRQYLGTFRSYYDREGRTMGTASGFGVRTTTVRSCFMFVGEDQFEDPATRERCISMRIPSVGRETKKSYEWMEDHKHLFTGVTYQWILEYCNTDFDKLRADISELDMELRAAGCPQRTSRNWAAMGVFGMQLCQKFLPDYDFKSYMVEACKGETSFQKSNSTLMQFWESVEALMGKDNSPINTNHIMVDNCGKKVHMWYPYIYKAVNDDQRGRLPFSKNAVLTAIKDEPYYVRDDLRKQLGISGTRPRVLTLDLEKCPEVVKNIAKVMDDC